MATASIIKAIDEKFLQCAICMEQLKQPKILPCLHRYCRDCLGGTVTKRDKDITCPTCREIHTLPRNGVDGLKTDFNTKNIIEFVQGEHAAKHKTEKQGTSKDAPMCHDHPGKPLELFCTTCGNQPICVSCIIGAHKSHDLQEVSALAQSEREKLTKKTEELMRYKEKIYKRQDQMKIVKRKLQRKVNAKKDELQEEFDTAESEIEREIRDKDDHLEQRRKKLEDDLKRKVSPRKQQLEKEMKDAKDRYDAFCRDEKQRIDNEFEKLQKEIDKDKEELHQKLESMNKGMKDLMTSLQTQERENSQKIRNLTDHFTGITKRFEALTTTASSILSANHDWTGVQSIPIICTEIDTLIKDVKKDFPEIETLSDIAVGGLSSAASDRRVKVDISEKEESVVSIKAVTTKDWNVRGITGTGDGRILITGRASNNESHITLINTVEGRSSQKVLRSAVLAGWRYCEVLSEFKIATVCWNDEVGVYDVRDGSYRNANISDIINTWPKKRKVRSVAVDHDNRHILVGGLGSKDVYVFNGALQHIRTVTLPKVIEYPYDMAIKGDILLVCDLMKYRALAVSMKTGSVCDTLYEFTKPAIGDNCEPRSVYADREGFVYMLWRGEISGQERNILVQYSQDGGHLLQTRLVECKDAVGGITTVETGQGEKLLIATAETGKLIRYGLVKSGM